MVFIGQETWQIHLSYGVGLGLADYQTARQNHQHLSRIFCGAGYSWGFSLSLFIHFQN